MMENKRKHVRFDPDENSLIELFKRDQQGKMIKAVGLVRDESHNGCGAIFRKKFPFKEGEVIYANVGKLTELKAEIIWIKQMDTVLIKVGIFLS